MLGFWWAVGRDLRKKKTERTKMFVVIAQAEFCHENQQNTTKDASIVAVSLIG